jgi:queuine tRNA-ribosyltransferase
MTTPSSFKLTATDGKRGAATISMPRGTIRTPAFMPVGTGGTVKAMYMDQVRDLGADIILGNTYHLMLRPGAERVARLGRPAPISRLALRSDPDRFRRVSGDVAVGACGR